MEYKLIDNLAAGQYEFQVGGFLPRIVYRKSGDKIYLTHTEVPAPLEGKGIASMLVKGALEDIRQKGLKLVPLCPFVIRYIQRHPEWEFLILKEKK